MNGAEIKTTLRGLGMTQTEFCRLVGCQPPTLSRYIHGVLPVPPPMATLVAVLRAMHQRGDDAAGLLREVRQSPNPAQ